MDTALRPSALAGAALVGAGMITATPVVAPPLEIHTPAVQLTADGSGLFGDSGLLDDLFSGGLFGDNGLFDELFDSLFGDNGLLDDLFDSLFGDNVPDGSADLGDLSGDLGTGLDALMTDLLAIF